MQQASLLKSQSLPLHVLKLHWIALVVLAFSWPCATLAQKPLGIDVSYWQGADGMSQATWNNVFASGRTFAFCRCTHFSTPGTEAAAHGDPDPSCGNNVARARAAGLLVGIYHFARPSLRDPQTEANGFVNYATTYFGANMIGPGYLRPVLDLESGSATDHVGASSLAAWATAWLDAVEFQTGVKPIIYCGGNYAKLLDASVATRTLWFANYICAADPQNANPVASLGPWSSWTFWQYCSSLSVGGVTPVDTDVFNGTADQLKTYVIVPHVPPAISQVQATGVTQNRVTIAWTTDTAATSQVEYGPTNSYGNSSPQDDTRVTIHLVSLSGLDSGTLYHFRVISVNDYGPTNTSDFNFTTTSPPVAGGSQDSEGPVLHIDRPSDGQIVSAASVTVSGTATDDGRGSHGISSVTVNGKTAEGGTADDDATASWHAEVPLFPGPNIILVAADDDSDQKNPTTHSFSINYDPSASNATATGVFKLIVGAEETITAGQSATLHAFAENGTPPYQFEWTPGDWLDQPHSATSIASPPVTTLYTITVIDAEGETLHTSVQVNVEPADEGNSGGQGASSTQARAPGCGAGASMVFPFGILGFALLRLDTRRSSH